MLKKIRQLPFAFPVIVAVAALMAIRLLAFTREFSVNMMFWDQWDVYGVFFRGGSFLDAFRLQHGPHRQGLGALAIWVVAQLTSWDGQGDAFLVAGGLIACAVLALALKYRLVGKWSVIDVWIPILFLSLNQYELVAIVPNVAAGALPVALILCLALALTVKQPGIQAMALVVIGFFLLYTGYGFIAASLLPFLFLFRAAFPVRSGFARNTQALWLAALFVSLASLYSFYADWKFTAAVDCFVFPHSRPVEYLMFAGLMVGQGFGLVPLADAIGPANAFAIVAGCAVAFGATAIALKAAPTRAGAPIVALITFSLVLIASTAIGRVCLGPLRQPLSSRYMTLILPMILGVYLWAAQGDRLRHLVTGCGILGLIGLSVIGPFFRDPFTLEPVVFRNARIDWKSCYLEMLDPYKCDAVVSQQMYPSTDRIIDRLRFLEAHRLNLFKDVPRDVQFTGPPDGARVLAGPIDFVGTVDPPGFERYQLQWGVGEFPKEWNWLSGPHLAVVRAGSLGRWDVSSLPPGAYSVRVTAFTTNGRQRVSIVRFVKP